MSADERLPPEIRSTLAVYPKLAAHEPVDNRFPQGGFEQGNGDDWAGGAVSSEKAFHGENSLRVDLGPPHAGARLLTDIPARPGTYLLVAIGASMPVAAWRLLPRRGYPSDQFRGDGREDAAVPVGADPSLERAGLRRIGPLTFPS